MRRPHLRAGWQNWRPRKAAASLSISALISLICLIAAPVAQAHPYLIAAQPEAGVVASTAPSKIQIAFTEGLEIQGCSISITRVGGANIKVATPTLTLGGDAMSAKFPKLTQGIYQVNWVAYGDDGHTVEGSYRFGVPSTSGQPPAGADQLLASTTAAGESAPTESLISVAGRWVGSFAAFALLAAGALFFVLRRRNRGDTLDSAVDRWQTWVPLAGAVALVGTLAEAIKRADGARGFDLGLLTSSLSNVSILIRLGALLLGGVALLALGRRRRVAVGALTGLVVLASIALDGHVATVKVTPALAAIGMIAHLWSAALWFGAVLVLAIAVVPAAIAAGDGEILGKSVRAYAPVAILAGTVTAITGVIAAVREVHRWYFLWWSGYGHLLLIKTGLVGIVALVGATGALLASRHAVKTPAPQAGVIRARRLGLVLRLEAVFALGVLALAVVLAGTLQGRGQPLPSQRGNLLPGAGFADVAITGGDTGQVTLAPAEVGLNRIIVQNINPSQTGFLPPTAASSVSVALACDCGGRNLSLKATLHPGSAGRDGPWVGEVGLPLDGTYSAQLVENGQPTVGAPAFTVGDISSPGSTPVTVASVADLSGPDGADCRSQEIGALDSIELMNASGGLGGRKIRQVLLDDGGSATVARQDALQLAAQHPVAFLDPCGQGAGAVLKAVGNSIPTIVADDNVPVIQGKYIYRMAPNPEAEGYSIGEYIAKIGVQSEPKAPKRVAAFVSGGANAQARLAGLRAALTSSGIKLVVYPGAGPQLVNTLIKVSPQLQWLGIYADGNFDTLTAALRQVGNKLGLHYAPAPIMVPQDLASERFIIDSGQLGAEGQIRALTDVDPTSNDAQLYAELAPQVVGELATVPGLSGFVSGQALAYGMVKGGSRSSIAARLARPGVFSQIATGPWESTDPADGTEIFRMLLAEFLPDNLVPSINGGPSEPYEGDFFTDGAWEQATPELLSPLDLGSAAYSPYGP